jgi:hypothetical protein
MSAPEENGEDLEALEILVLDCIIYRMAEKGLDPSGITKDLIFRNKKCLTALELCEWLKLLENPLLVSADCVESLLGLRNSTVESSPEELPVATIYKNIRLDIRTAQRSDRVLVESQNYVQEQDLRMYNNKTLSFKQCIRPSSLCRRLGCYKCLETPRA